MEESQYEEYLRTVFGLDEKDEAESLIEQLRDDDGYAVGGCYRTKPVFPS